jgi:hypothetical protein
MSFAGAILLVAGFITLIKIFGLFKKSTDAITVAKLAYADFQNPRLSDDAKEVALQRHAKKLFSLFFLITFGSAAALALPVGFIWLLEQINMLSLNAVIATTLSWEFLLVSTILTAVVFWIVRKR